MELDFEIDKITESIENAQTGEVYKTLVVPVTQEDIKNVTKKNGWRFDWKSEIADPEWHVYKLVTIKEPNIVHGLISLKKDKGYVFLNLIESAPFNFGKSKKHLGVAGNLVAFGCKLSKEYGFDGVVCFEPKTALIPHYEKTLGAVMISKKRMAIFEKRAQLFIEQYFSELEE